MGWALNLNNAKHSYTYSTFQANWFKRALTENELIELCEKIVLTLKK